MSVLAVSPEGGWLDCLEDQDGEGGYLRREIIQVSVSPGPVLRKLNQGTTTAYMTNIKMCKDDFNPRGALVGDLSSYLERLHQAGSQVGR